MSGTREQRLIPGTPSFWTDEHIEVLTKLWQDGLSASQVAKQLGGVTRNAVISKVHRLGLSGRATPSAPKATTAKNVRPQNLGAFARQLKLAGNSMVFHEPAVTRPPRVVIQFRQEAPGFRTPMTLQAHQCKWPIGTPGAEDFTHCGQRAPDGPYCASHAEIAYRPPEERKTSANELARSLRRYL